MSKMKKYNLIDLLSNEIEINETAETVNKVKIDGIKIPIIQRDYAQGRKSEFIIRNRFLTALFDALYKGEELELDFVYGSVKKINNKENVFLPLDGQQRLTTLYLLYWFVGNIELKENVEKLTNLRQILKGFSYATRSTATDFCEKIAELSFNKNPAEEIKKSYWFQKRFEKDPTVNAMLNMLDAIKLKYDEIDKPVFENLGKLCFYVLPLDGFELTDELYIKMNARGKQLTDFENFKADFNGWMISDSNELNQNFEKTFIYNGLQVPYYLLLLSKIDNQWTNIFWNYLLEKRNQIEDTQEKEKFKMVVDPYFMNFISRIILNFSITESSLSTSEIELTPIFRTFYSEINNSKYSSFDLYEEFFKADFAVNKFEKILDSLVEHYDEITQLSKPIWSKNSNWSILDESITQQQRIVFCGICLYLEKNTFDSTHFSNWIRVVWNIAIDPDIRSIAVMINAMKLIKELSIGNENIYEFFETQEYQDIINKRNDFFKAQLQEEKIKATFLSDSKWYELIEKGESHPLFIGNIGFLINDLPSIQLFEKRIENATYLFDSFGANKSLTDNHSLIRFLVCKFSNWNQLDKFDFSDSEINWRLILRRNSEYKYNEIIKELCSLESIEEIIETIDESLKQDSTISGTTESLTIKFRKTHNNLYKFYGFFSWINSSKSNKIKWINEHIFIIRPGAWYDKVMIDCYRNELIYLFVSEYNLATNNKKCGSSNFFKEESVIFLKQFENRLFALNFNIHGYLTLDEKIEENWINILSMDYRKINNNEETVQFLSDFKNAIKENPDNEILRVFE